MQLYRYPVLLQVHVSALYTCNIAIHYCDFLLLSHTCSVFVFSLQMCFQSNIFCLVVTTIGAALLSVDLGEEKAAPLHYQVLLISQTFILQLLVHTGCRLC